MRRCPHNGGMRATRPATDYPVHRVPSISDRPLGRGVVVGAAAAGLAVPSAYVCAGMLGTASDRGAGLVLSAAAFGVLAAATVVLVVVDLREHRLPDPVVAATGILGGALLAAAALAGGDPMRALQAIAAAAAVFALFAIAATLRPGALGGGDVKLSAVVGGHLAWFGWEAVVLGVALGFVLGGLQAGVLLVTRSATRSSRIAFGPAMLAGAWIVLGAHVL